MKMKNNSDRPARAEPPPQAFDPIDAALRQMFDKMSEEEVPDDFSALVAQFAQQQRERGAR